MKRYLPILAAYALGVLVALLFGAPALPARAEGQGAALLAQQQSTPTAQAAPSSTPSPAAGQTGQRSSIPTAAATASPTATQQPIQPGSAQCLDCTPLAARVKLSHYNPTVYNPAYPQLNCWEFSEEHNYCLSPTWIGVPWESGWGLFAACPAAWGVGTWVDIPEVGVYICMDHGGDITCDNSTGVCKVDLLGPGGAAWDGLEYDVTLWVPKSYLIRLQRGQSQ
jgi:3D (Asp-Asp-Asp) domain-containing protein